jgi:hypothetical protein
VVLFNSTISGKLGEVLQSESLALTTQELHAAYGEVGLTAGGAAQWWVLASDNQDSTWASNGPFTLVLEIVEALTENDHPLPREYALSNLWPNPFNGELSVTFELPGRSIVALDVYNLLGRRVTKLTYGVWSPGVHTIHWNARGLGSGSYIIVMRAGRHTFMKRVLLLR